MPVLPYLTRELGHTNHSKILLLFSVSLSLSVPSCGICYVRLYSHYTDVRFLMGPDGRYGLRVSSRVKRDSEGSLTRLWD